jgi:hypothetical protein
MNDTARPGPAEPAGFANAARPLSVSVYAPLSRLCAMNPRMAIDCIACARMPTAAWSMPVAAQNNQLHGRPKRAYSLRWQKIIPSPYSKPRELKKLFESQWFEWPDGTIEQSAGPFVSDCEARDWIVRKSQAWLGSWELTDHADRLATLRRTRLENPKRTTGLRHVSPRRLPRVKVWADLLKRLASQ